MVSQSDRQWQANLNDGNYKTGNFRFRLLNTGQHDRMQVEKHAKYHRSYTVADYIEHVLSVTCFEEFFLFASKLKSDCGFSIIGGGMSHKSMDQRPAAHFFYSSACGGGWADYYSRHLIEDDPVVYYCHHNVLPLVWETDKDFRLIRGLNSHMAGAMVDFGIRGFVTVPTHGTDTLLSGFRFTIAQHDRITRRDIDSQLPLLSLLSTFMHEALSRILALDRGTDKIRLTRREKDVLRWVSCGLSTWEISENLSISENTVLHHIKNIHTKLNVRSRQHAVAKALSLNLI